MAFDPTQPSIEETASRGFAWALAGAVFGLIFVALNELFDAVAPSPFHLLLSITLTGGLTALIYGSMRLSALVTTLIFIATVLYMWLNPANPDMTPLVVIGCGIGIIIGAIYGRLDRKSRVYCADAKLVGGLVSGLAIALPLAAAALLLGEIPYPWLAMVAAPLVILTYVSSASWFIKRCQKLLPPMVDGALVGLAVGALLGLLFMILAAILGPELLTTEFDDPYASRVQQAWGWSIAGSAGICVAVGIVRSLLKIRWYDL